MWLKKHTESSEPSALSSLSFQPHEHHSPFSTVTNKVGFPCVSPLSNSRHLSLSCSRILQNVASASILEFWTFASSVSSSLFHLQFSRAVLPSLRLPRYRFPSCPVCTRGMGRWRFLSSLILSSPHPLPLSLSLVSVLPSTNSSLHWKHSFSLLLA